ncbi:MAG: ribbon-helix-helix protein, CopG family [Kiritimatiellae bacterium]|nr:ribbon-helix-helix protein, CopG family [Kiritimatiellia bacterium]
MVRTQIQLTDELAAHVKEAAARQHVSMAGLIRRALAEFLASSASVGDERYARALGAAGRFASGRRDLSHEHDAHFAEASRK